MKKLFKSALIILLVFLMISPNAVYAAPTAEPTQKAETDNTRATGLIATYGFALSKYSDGVLRVIAQVACTASVVKCGYENAVIQRRHKTSAVWSNYIDLGDSYVDGCVYTSYTNYNVDSNYYYRVYSDFYAKKNIFSVQRIEEYVATEVLI